MRTQAATALEQRQSAGDRRDKHGRQNTFV